MDINFILGADLDYKLANKSILVTGGNGFIASYIIKSLLEASRKYELNIKVISIIRSNSN